MFLRVLVTQKIKKQILLLGKQHETEARPFKSLEKKIQKILFQIRFEFIIIGIFRPKFYTWLEEHKYLFIYCFR